MSTTADARHHREHPTLAGHAAVLAGLVAAACALAACSPASSEPTPETTSPAVTTPATTSPRVTASPARSAFTRASSSSEPSGASMSDTSIRLVIGDQQITARLRNNPAARSLIGQLPLTLNFSDYGGQEIQARPPKPLTMTGMPSGQSAPRGTIGYYEPDRVVVLYYTDVARFEGIVRIGEMDGDVSALSGWNSSRPVTIERAG